MYCNKCGKPLPQESEYCPFCGNKVQVIDNTANDTADAMNKGTVLEKETAVKKDKLIKALVGCCLILIVVLGIVLFSKGHREEQNSEIKKQEEQLDEQSLANETKTKTANEIAQLSDSVVTIYVYDKSDQLTATGSGCIVGNDTTVVTNYHVIDQAYRAEVVTEGNVVYGIKGVSYYDIDRDIAILKLDTSTSLKPLDISTLEGVNIGDSVYAIGSPKGLQNTVSNGIISAIRNEEGLNYIQFTAPISSGSSGGALLNDKGDVIGVVSSYIEGQNLNFAIPSDDFVSCLDVDTYQTLADVSEENRIIGNTFQNYSNDYCQLVEFNGKVFHSYNFDSEIYEYDMRTTMEQKLGIKGTNLSIYQGKLFYINDDKLCSYDLNTGEICKNVLYDLGYRNSATLLQCFITRNGYTLVYFEEVVQMDFQGKPLGSFRVTDDMWYWFVLVNESKVATFDFNLCKLIVLSLTDLNCQKIDLGFTPSSLAVGDENILYIGNSEEENTLKYNYQTGETEWCNGVSGFSGINKNKAYYTKRGMGTYIRTENKNESAKRISTQYEIGSMCFVSNGTIFGNAHTAGTSILDETYVTYYVRLKEEGQDLKVLDQHTWNGMKKK